MRRDIRVRAEQIKDLDLERLARALLAAARAKREAAEAKPEEARHE